MAKADLVVPDKGAPRGATLSGPVPQTNGGATLLVPPTAEINSAISAHAAAGDPHTAYALDSDLTTHSAAGDPHTGYIRKSPAASQTVTSPGAGFNPLVIRGAVGQGAHLLIAEDSAGTDLAWITSNGQVNSQGSPVHTTANHGSTGDPHSQYASDADLSAHVAAADPHADYVNTAELVAHGAAADPHTNYQQEADKGQPSGYASLNASTHVPTAQLGSGAADATKFLRGDSTWSAPPAATPPPSPGTGTTASGVGDATFQGTSPDYSRTDHLHGREAFGGVTAATSFGIAAAAGTSASVSHADHTHGTPAAPAGVTPGALTTASAFGDATAHGASADFSRTDHKHGREANPVTAHVAAGDPHTQYATDADLSSHAAAADPHTGYQLESEKAAASGYASLDSTTRVPTGQLGAGAADATKFLRGDQTWAVPPASGGSTILPGTGTTASAQGDATAHGTSPDYSRTDHKHGRESFGAVTAETSFGLASANGVSTNASRSDHAHGTPTNPVTAHEAAADPHTGYQKESEKGVASGYAALDGGTKVPIAQVPTGTTGSTVSLGNHAHAGVYDPAGTGSGAITTHEAAADPHTGYQKESEKGAASGYASLDATTHVPLAQLGTGTASGTNFLRGDGAWAAPATGATPGTSTTTSAVADATAQGTAPEYARSDHRHGREAFGAVAAETAFGSASTNGVATTVSRSDHKHGNPAYTDPVPAHVALADPHTVYQKESEREVNNGYPGLDTYGFLQEPWRKAAAYPTTRNDDVTGGVQHYAKIMSGTFDAQYDLTAGLMAISIADINRANTSSAARFGLVRWDFTQVSPAGNQPHVVLEQIGGTLTALDLILVVTGVGPTTWELYLGLNSQWQIGWVSPLNMGVNKENTWTAMPVTWHESEALVLSLPAGTQYPLVSTSTPGWVNVRDFGAVGNGTTDDTVAFQNAIIAAEMSSMTVYVPASPQPYCISQTLVLDYPGLAMIGAGKGYQVTITNFQRVTELKWIGAAGGPMIHVVNADGTSRIAANKVMELALDGNDLATPCLQVSGGWGGKYDVLVRNAAAGSLLGAMYMVATNGGDCANNDVDLVLGMGNNGPGLRMHSSPNSARNTCLNRIHSIWGYYGHDNLAPAHGVVVAGTDHNTIEWMWLFHETLGTDDVVGSTATQFELLFCSHATQGAHARKNVVRFCGGGAGRDDPNVWFQGTAQGANPSRENIVEWIDMQGRAANPVVGAGSVDNRWFGDSKFWNYQASAGM